MMLNAYLNAAMRTAQYELLSDTREFYGELSGCCGVCATASTLEECRDQLAEVLEEWVLLRLRRNLELPVINGVGLAVAEVAE